jgi:hypothetical protein
MNIVKQNTLQIKIATDDMIKVIKKKHPSKKKTIEILQNANDILIEYSTCLPQRIEQIQKFNKIILHEHMVDCIKLLQSENMINYKKVDYFKKRGRDIFSNQPSDII